MTNKIRFKLLQTAPEFLPGVQTAGNRKLINNENTAFMTWNLPAAITCPFATNACILSCYARKAERCYPSAKANRRRNLFASTHKDFAKHMIYTIEAHLTRKFYNGKRVIFRIHESGDFYSQEYTDAWLEIVKHFEHDDRITFIAYTKSFRFFLNREWNREKLIIRASVWNDTSAEQLELIKALNLPIYTAVEKETTNYFICRCEDCATCNACLCNAVKAIACLIH